MRQSNLVILDLDGTLIDSRADLATAVNLTRRDYDLPPLTVETVTGHVGNGIRKLAERSLGEVLQTVPVGEVISRLQGHYSEHMFDETTLFPGVLPALSALSASGYCLAVVTNKPHKPALDICRHLSIDRFLATVLGGDACANLKPHPEPLLLALRLTHTAADGSWIVGDNYTDMLAGRRAGLSRCYCRYGFGRLEGEAYEVIVDNLEEFPAYLQRRQ